MFVLVRFVDGGIELEGHVSIRGLQALRKGLNYSVGLAIVCQAVTKTALRFSFYRFLVMLEC